jgi:phosphatidylserine decarboxylase
LITKYGYDVFFTISALCLIIAVGSFLLIEIAFLKYLLIVFAICFELLSINFFRDPDRVSPSGDELVISPADGTVVAINQTHESEFMKSEAVQISIFMSPLNVHVNRIPVSGTVQYCRHLEGEYFAAFVDKASLKNEQTHIGIESAKFRIFFKQIAGFVARRIVCQLTPGDVVTAGKRFGMIKFGSRVDVFVPKNSDIKVRMNDRTVAGETVLAVLR